MDVLLAAAKEYPGLTIIYIVLFGIAIAKTVKAYRTHAHAQARRTGRGRFYRSSRRSFIPASHREINPRTRYLTPFEEEELRKEEIPTPAQ